MKPKSRALLFGSSSLTYLFPHYCTRLSVRWQELYDVRGQLEKTRDTVEEQDRQLIERATLADRLAQQINDKQHVIDEQQKVRRAIYNALFRKTSNPFLCFPFVCVMRVMTNRKYHFCKTSNSSPFLCFSFVCVIRVMTNRKIESWGNIFKQLGKKTTLQLFDSCFHSPLFSAVFFAVQ